MFFRHSVYSTASILLKTCFRLKKSRGHVADLLDVSRLVEICLKHVGNLVENLVLVALSALFRRGGGVSYGLLCNFVAVYLTSAQFILQLKLCLYTVMHLFLREFRNFLSR